MSKDYQIRTEFCDGEEEVEVFTDLNTARTRYKELRTEYAIGEDHVHTFHAPFVIELIEVLEQHAL